MFDVGYQYIHITENADEIIAREKSMVIFLLRIKFDFHFMHMQNVHIYVYSMLSKH